MLFDSHKDAPSGFALKIMPTGGKTFVLRYTIDGRQRLKVIGAFPAWSVEAARKEAQRLIREVDQGHDPLEEKRRRRLEPTLGELATEWLDKHVAGLKSADDVRRYVLKDIVPALGKMKVSAIRRRDVLDLIEGKAATAPRAAAILLRVARQLFTYAVDREVIPASPVADLKPSSIKTREHPRGLVKVVGERVLNKDEIKILLPFASVVPEHRRDPGLGRKLEEEASGILNRLLQGLREYREIGLAVPDDLKAAVATFVASSDMLSSFLKDATEQMKGETVGAQELYRSYRSWCGSSGIRNLSAPQFRQELLKREYTTKRLKSGNAWSNLRLRQAFFF